MSQVQDSPIFSAFFSTPASSQIWTDRTRTSHYLTFEAALAKVQGELGIIPAKAAREIEKACGDGILGEGKKGDGDGDGDGNKGEGWLDWEILKERTGVIGYPVLGVVEQLVKRVNGVDGGDNLGEWAHWGATTQDVTDTALTLQLQSTLSLLTTSLTSIILALNSLCNTHKSTPLPARSNLQQAVPISYGFKLARTLAAFLRHRDRLAELRPRLLLQQFSGAAGTLATLPPTPEHPELGMECQDLLAKELGLGVPTISWHTDRDNIAEYASLLSLLTSSCSKLALDIKLQMQSEVAEVSEPYVPHRGSSSTMPQKRNPISCAYITATNATVRALCGSIHEDVATEDHERSTGAWEIEWIVLPQISTLAHATLEQTRTLLEGLEVHPEGMRRNLELSKGAIVSEAVMMALGRKGMGRQKAHDIVYDLCRAAVGEGRGLVELLMECEDVRALGVGRGELEEWCDPGRYLGYSEVMVERVLKMC